MTDTIRTLRFAINVAAPTSTARSIREQLSDQLHSITRTNGVVIQTLIGTLGANPRKGVTHTVDDLVAALVDVAVQALFAVETTDEVRGARRVGAAYSLMNKLGRVALRAGAAPDDDIDRDTLDFGWECLLGLSRWVDAANSDRDREAQLWGRVAKLAEEVGEASDAFLRLDRGSLREADRAPIDELTEELLDVAVAALGAAEHVIGNTGSVKHALLDTAVAAASQRLNWDAGTIWNVAENGLQSVMSSTGGAKGS